jgi:hypothetical protein
MGFFDSIKGTVNDVRDVAETGIDTFNSGRDAVSDLLTSVGLGLRRGGAAVQRTGRVIGVYDPRLLGGVSDDFIAPVYSLTGADPTNNSAVDEIAGIAALGVIGFVMYAALTSK